MTYDDLIKQNFPVLLGLGLLALVLPKVVPELRPTLRSAIRVGIDLFAESEAEAEAELVHSLVSATLRAIRDALAAPVDTEQKRQRVRRSIRHFKQQARNRAHRWGGDDGGRTRCYQRHVETLDAALHRQQREAGSTERPIIASAAKTLADEHSPEAA